MKFHGNFLQYYIISENITVVEMVKAKNILEKDMENRPFRKRKKKNRDGKTLPRK